MHCRRVDRHSPRHVRHWDFISQFTSDIRHVQGSANSAADALSRLNVNALHTSASPPVMMNNSLHSTSHVFVLHDAVRKPLQQPYDGPYLVLDRSAKFFTLDIKGRKDTVSIDRLKPAYLDESVTVDFPTVVAPSSAAPAGATSSIPQPPATMRSGRRVHWPAHLRDFTP